MPVTDINTLLEIKKHLDNEWTGNQIAAKLGVGVSVVSSVWQGKRGDLPIFESDPQLKTELWQYESAKMREKQQRKG